MLSLLVQRGCHSYPRVQVGRDGLFPGPRLGEPSLATLPRPDSDFVESGKTAAFSQTRTRPPWPQI